MNCDDLQQLTALASLGALEEPELQRLQVLLAGDPKARAELARFNAVIAALANGLPRKTPPPALKDRILAALPRPESTTPPPAPSPFGFVPHDAPWVVSPLPGARIKLLATSPAQGYGVVLVELAPGTRYPEHDHEGNEELFVISGDLQTEGRTMGPGDFLHAEQGSHHHELYSPNGCTALMVVPLQGLLAFVQSPPPS